MGDAGHNGEPSRRGNGWRIAALVTLLVGVTCGLGAAVIYIVLSVVGAAVQLAPLNAVSGWAVVFGLPVALLAVGLFLLLRLVFVACLVASAVLFAIWAVRRRG